MEGEVIIDGGIYRTEADRVSVLLGYAAVEIERSRLRMPDSNGIRLRDRYNELNKEYQVHLDEPEFEYWCEIEDDVIELISDALPIGWVCELAEHDPGTVLVAELGEDVYEYEEQ